LLILIFSNSKDAKGRPLADKSTALSVALGVLVFVYVIGMLAAIAIPQYARYRRLQQDSAAESAYHSVSYAQEAYFADNGRYTNDYKELSKEVGIVYDDNIIYSQIDVNNSCFKFSVSHKAPGSTKYNYNSCGNVTVTIDN
jgi:Tfp pilus assembly protein PilE